MIMQKLDFNKDGKLVAYTDNISEKAHDFNSGLKAPNDFSDSQYI